MNATSSTSNRRTWSTPQILQLGYANSMPLSRTHPSSSLQVMITIYFWMYAPTYQMRHPITWLRNHWMLMRWSYHPLGIVMWSSFYVPAVHSIWVTVSPRSTSSTGDLIELNIAAHREAEHPWEKPTPHSTLYLATTQFSRLHTFVS